MLLIFYILNSIHDHHSASHPSRIKESVLPNLAAAAELVLSLPLTPLQLRYYKWILVRDARLLNTKTSLTNGTPQIETLVWFWLVL